MSWRGSQGGIEAANAGHDVIMSPNTYCYLDYYQSEDFDSEPPALPAYLPLHQVYQFIVVPQKIAADKRHHILGGQGNIWTEFIPTFDQVQYMAFPRAIAIADILWNHPEERDYDSFTAPAGKAPGLPGYAGYQLPPLGRLKFEISMQLEKEIAQQPAVLQRLLHEGQATIQEVAAAIRAFDPAFACIAARGTSDTCRDLCAVSLRLAAALAGHAGDALTAYDLCRASRPVKSLGHRHLAIRQSRRCARRPARCPAAGRANPGHLQFP